MCQASGGETAGPHARGRYPPRMPPTVFLDRDDTLIDTQGITAQVGRAGDLFDPGLLTELMPGVGPALARLQHAGVRLVVFTSQGAVARGPGGLREVEQVMDKLRALLAAHGVRLAGLYYSPHHPTGTVAPFNVEHPWRKPAPGMLLAAAAELGVDLATAFAIGDKPRDVEAARNAGIAPERTFLLRTSGEAGDCADVAEAADRILGMLGARAG